MYYYNLRRLVAVSRVGTFHVVFYIRTIAIVNLKYFYIVVIVGFFVVIIL